MTQLTPKQMEQKKELRQVVINELVLNGWQIDGETFIPPSGKSKVEIRKFHTTKRVERAASCRKLVDKYGAALLQEFANGPEISPASFNVDLVPVLSDTHESRLFRFASLLWSVPVSQGYGRRMRFLVRDTYNGKLVGIFALGDPVFNLKMRDDFIGWNSNDRQERLYHVMDAFVLGAVPPYNRLLAGKLLALLTLSNELRKEFTKKYRKMESVIAERNKTASLVLVTTTSALGKSSVYNRLQLPNEEQRAFMSVGYSGGWGHFHFSDSTFSQLRDWLREQGDKNADGHQYGKGPNWRMRAIRKALELLGFNMDLLKHGVKREIFLAPVAENYKEYLRGEHKMPRYIDRPMQAIVEFYKTRWLIPRAERIDDWKIWTRQDTWNVIADNADWPDDYQPNLL